MVGTPWYNCYCAAPRLEKLPPVNRTVKLARGERGYVWGSPTGVVLPPSLLPLPVLLLFNAFNPVVEDEHARYQLTKGCTQKTKEFSLLR